MSAQGWVGASQATGAKKVEEALQQADHHSENVEETWVMAIPTWECQGEASPP